MKNEHIIAIAAALIVLVLGVQSYMTFRLNERLNQLIGNSSSLADVQPKMLSPLKHNLPQPDLDADFLKGQPWNPYEEIQHMQNEMEQMFDESFSRFHMKTPLGSLSTAPDVNLQDKSDRYIVTVNAPGADESSMQVKLDDRVLHIAIKTEQTKDDVDDKNGTYQYRERFVGEFQRALTLPGSANAVKMKTEYHNGVLTITIPKA
jgi:HSP20 family protein